jgi:hypothetical protein
VVTQGPPPEKALNSSPPPQGVMGHGRERGESILQTKVSRELIAHPQQEPMGIHGGTGCGVQRFYCLVAPATVDRTHTMEGLPVPLAMRV